MGPGWARVRLGAGAAGGGSWLEVGPVADRSAPTAIRMMGAGTRGGKGWPLERRSIGEYDTVSGPAPLGHACRSPVRSPLPLPSLVTAAMSPLRTPLLVLTLLAAVGATPVEAQIGLEPFRPHASWRTVETEHFQVHFPAEAEGWTLPIVERMESMHREVARVVGHAPGRKVTVLVADPTNQANGYAISLLDYPTTTLWPTPPGPRSGIGDHRGWGELLFVHEYAHLAHLTIPSRNRREALAWGLLPVRSGPVARRTPRWMVEGYATWIEGLLTGAGRPHGAARPAFLRLRALEGRLPSYREMSGAQGYQDMAAAYLAGSAFVEWLIEREGEESLQHLWRRLSAREVRSFDEAFEGVYGGPPVELYGRFTVDLVEGSLAVRDSLDAVGLHEGELIHLRRWHTGDPALSPDGARVVLELHRRDRPSELVVWSTEVDEEALERRAKARERLLERDPEDVPAVAWRPPPRRELARLPPRDGRSFTEPRFLPDGEGILAVRWEPLGDGSLRPDLHLWSPETGEVRRVTRGASVRSADPAPDGERAVGVRCEWGSCDLVMVALGTGTVETLLPGTPDRTFHRPRWLPDEEGVVVAVQEGGRWRVARVDLPGPGSGSGPMLRWLDPQDGFNRYDPAPLPGGEGVVVVSEVGGVPNLEVLALRGGNGLADPPRSLTRVLGAVAAPEPDPAGGGIWFLNLHSRGLDVRRVDATDGAVGEAVPLDSELWPVAPRGPERPPPTFESEPIPTPSSYGRGPTRMNVLGVGARDAGGAHGGAALFLGDPVGRWSLVGQGRLGDAGSWTGGGASLMVRGVRPALLVQGFGVRQEGSGGPGASVHLDGAAVGMALDHMAGPTRYAFRLLGFGGRLGAPGDGSVGVSDREATGQDPAVPAAAETPSPRRTLAVAEASAEARLLRGGVRLTPTLHLHVTGGRTDGEAWSRLMTRAGLRVGLGPLSAGGEAVYGRLDGGAGFERFRVGGGEVALLDPALLSQVIAVPAAPPGLLAGERLAMGRVALGSAGPTPFFQAISLDPRRGEWWRIVGVEQRLALPVAPQLALPGMDLTLGVAHTLDDPFRNRTRGWVGLTLRP